MPGARNHSHLTEGCQAFAVTEYKERHGSVGKIIHQELAKNIKLIQKDQLPYYKYIHEAVLENNDISSIRTAVSSETNLWYIIDQILYF